MTTDSAADGPGARQDTQATRADAPQETAATKAEKKQRRTAAWERRRANRLRGEARSSVDAAVARHGVELVRSLAAPPARVCTYESWPVEPPTAALNAALADAGYELLVPITLPDLDLDWRPIGSPDDPASGLGHEVLADVAVMLSPGTLVDRRGTRLGQGGGCYDRSIPRLRAGVPVVTVLFDDELTDEPLPRAAHDAVVQGVLQPRGVTWLDGR